MVLESDKSSMEIPSDYSGKVVEVFVNSGEEVSTGQKLMTIETDESIVEKQSKTEPVVEIKEEREVGSPKKQRLVLSSQKQIEMFLLLLE